LSAFIYDFSTFCNFVATTITTRTRTTCKVSFPYDWILWIFDFWLAFNLMTFHTTKAKMTTAATATPAAAATIAFT